MKLKLLAAAALATVMTAPAMAAIDPISSGTVASGDGEMFFVVYNDTAKIAYTLDLGVYSKAFRAAADNTDAGFTRSWSMDQYFTNFVSAQGNNVADWRWMVWGGDGVGLGTPDDRSVIATITDGQAINDTTGRSVRATSNNQLQSGQASFFNYVGAINSFQGNAPFNDYTVNGGFTSTDPAVDYVLLPGFVGNNGNNNYQWTADNAVGTDARFVYVTRSGSSNLASAKVLADQFNSADGSTQGLFSFKAGADNQYALTYTLLPVPEPGALALMFAGLGALGFVGSRRRKQA